MKVERIEHSKKVAQRLKAIYPPLSFFSEKLGC